MEPKNQRMKEAREKIEAMKKQEQIMKERMKSIHGDCRGGARSARIMPIIQMMIMAFVIICICMAICIGIGSARNNYIAYNMNKHTSIKAEEEIVEPKTYSVYMILSELDEENTTLANNKIKITDTSVGDSLNLTVFNAVSDAPITADSDGNIEVPEDGIKLKLEIKEDTVGNIEIENVTSVEGYIDTFKKANIEINAQDGKLESYVKNITKETTTGEVTNTGSEENTAMFMYEEEENGVIKIKGNEYVETYYVIAGIDGLTEEELEEASWEMYDKENGIAVEKNGIVYTKSRYHDREYGSIKEINIRNIDKIDPIVEIKGKELNEAKDELTVVLGLKDGEATDEYGKSGLFGYAVTTTEDVPDEFIEIEQGEAGAIMRPYSDGEESEGADVGAGLAPSVSEGEKKFDCIIDVSGITENGKYYAWVIDKAGNIAHIEFNVTEIEEQESGAVVIILDAPVDSLIGTEYDSLDELMEALKTNGITKNSGTVIAQMVNDVKNDSTIVENQDIVLDLNGYTITSKLQDPTLRVKNGSVKVVDEKYEIAEYITDEELAQTLTEKYHTKTMTDESGETVNCIGKVLSENYIAVVVEENGVFTIGKGAEAYVHVDDTAPIIEGQSKGILNRGATFNFYGGIIIGKVPIEGTVTDTPVLYDATAEVNGDGRIKARLNRLADIEAMIGIERYTKLEDAISDANEKYGTSEEQIEIDIVMDISRTDIIEIPEGKNIILDLNGHKIVSSIYGYYSKGTLTNSGKLNIKDSRGESGEIKNNSDIGVYNKETGELEINGAMIGGNRGIFNEGIATINSVIVTDSSTQRNC